MITRSKFSQFGESGIVKRILGLLFLLAVFGSTTRPPRAQGVPSGWAPLQFLLGEWVGEGAGTEGAGAGACSFSMDLKDNVIVRKNRARYAATKDRPALAHDDLMIIYRDSPGAPLKAIFFDTEGHTIRYDVRVSADQKAIEFLSELSSSAPRYRLTYWNGGAVEVKFKFEIAPSGRPDEFAAYITGELHRK